MRTSAFLIDECVKRPVDRVDVTTFDDTSIVQAVLSGAPVRFSELVARYDRRVRREVSRFIDDESAQEDAVQEAFYRAFKNLDALDQPERFGAWLAEIARRIGIDYRRRTMARIVVDLRTDVENERASDNDPNPDDWIWEEVAQLRPRFIEVLTLCYRSGRSYAEIAHVLNTSLSTVRGRIFEARRALRQRLQDRGIEW